MDKQTKKSFKRKTTTFHIIKADCQSKFWNLVRLLHLKEDSAQDKTFLLYNLNDCLTVYTLLVVKRHKDYTELSPLSMKSEKRRIYSFWLNKGF